MHLPIYQLPKRDGQPWRIPLNLALRLFQTWVACALLALVMLVISNALGCRVNEGGTGACRLMGVDLQLIIVLPALMTIFGGLLFAAGVAVCVVVALAMWLLGGWLRQHNRN